VTRHRPRLALTLASPLLALPLSACGAQPSADPGSAATDPAVSSEASPGTPAPSSTSSPEPPSTGPASATRAEVRELGRALVKAGTGSFRSVTTLVGGRIERTGTYDLGRLAHTLRAGYQIGAESFSVDSVVVGEDFYFKFTAQGDQPTRCWTFVDYDSIATQVDEAGIVNPTDGAGGVPPELTTLLFLSLGAEGDTVSDLYTTASVMGSKFTTALAIDPDADDTTPIELTQGSDGSASWSTDFSTLMDSVIASGATPDPLIEGVLSPASSIQAEVSDIGEAVDVAAPPARLVVPMGDDDADQRAFEECNGA